MKKNGFSLVELLVVVAIIGILATIMAPNVKEHMRKARVVRTKTFIENLSLVVSNYKNDFGVYPPSYDPQKFYKAIMSSKTAYNPKAEDLKMFKTGQSFWIKEDRTEDTRRQSVLQTATVPPEALRAKEDEYVFIDSWGNPLYFISSDEYNPTGKSSITGQTSTTQKLLPCAYQMRKDAAGKQTRSPYNIRSFQLCSFGPDETTYYDNTGGGLFIMIDTDKVDNDKDERLDKADRPTRVNYGSSEPDFAGEDDVTNFM